ncbi:4-alpha-glucanotransferase [Sellimonas intestinalis]|uniref:4-alpha-glucanotransferase n=1 Tax=Sellimonas intestinalis TaxID=1653434 RepID=UPI0039910C41
MRETGILMPVSALPSRTGVGELGAYAYEFVEALRENGVKIWQILPLNPVGYGTPPYQPYSSCAGDEIYISLDLLFEAGLLKETRHLHSTRMSEPWIMMQSVLLKSRI